MVKGCPFSRPNTTALTCIEVGMGKGVDVDSNLGESFLGLLPVAGTGVGITHLVATESSSGLLQQPLGFLRTKPPRPHYRIDRRPHLAEGKFPIFFPQTVPGPTPKTDG